MAGWQLRCSCRGKAGRSLCSSTSPCWTVLLSRMAVLRTTSVSIMTYWRGFWMPTKRGQPIPVQLPPVGPPPMEQKAPISCTVSADFTGQGARDIIAIWNGHIHRRSLQ